MYIGNDLQIAHPSYKIIDDISSGFNGNAVSFALQVNGESPVPFPISTQQVTISVNGVIQEPDPSGSAGFKLLGSNIVFSSAPANGHAFFGVINAGADYVTAGSEFPDGSVTSPSFTFQADQDTGWFRSGSGAVNFSANGVNKVLFDGNGLTVTGTCTATAFSGNGANLTNVTANAAAAGTLTGATLASGVTASSLTSVGTLTGLSSSGDITSSGKLIASSSSSGDYVRLYGSAGTGKWDIYGHGANLRFSDNESAGSVVFDTSVQNVGIGTTSPSSAHKTHIVNSTYGLLKLETTLTGADGPYLELLHNSSSPADNDELGYIGFRGKNDNAEDITFAYINAKSIDVSDGTEDGELYFRTITGGSGGQLALTLNSTAATFAGKIGINEPSPDKMLHLTAANDDSSIRLENTADTPDNVWEISPSIAGVSNTGFTIRDVTDSRNALVIDGSGNTTFAGAITTNGITQYTLPTIANGGQLGWDDGTKSLRLYANSSTGSNATVQFHFNQSGTAGITFAQDSSAIFGGTVSDSKGNLRSIPLNLQSSTYTLVASDASKHVRTNANVTIPNNVFTAGDAVTIINQNSNDITLTQASGLSLFNAADASTGNRTLASRGMCTLLFTTASIAYISGAGLS